MTLMMLMTGLSLTHLSVAGSFSVCEISFMFPAVRTDFVCFSLWSSYNFPHASLKCASHSPRYKACLFGGRREHPFEAQVCFSSGLFWVWRQFFLRLTSPSADVGWRQDGETASSDSPRQKVFTSRFTSRLSCRIKVKSLIKSEIGCSSLLKPAITAHKSLWSFYLTFNLHYS